ncbi:MAG: Mov34/MPN/PAD-1 family protein [Candidatus Hodarchaeota archaeon]
MKYEKDIILFINKELLTEIYTCVEKALPNEACGLIFGKIQEHQKLPNKNEYSYYYHSYKFECIESSLKSPVAFLMDDYEKLIEISRKHSKNLQLLSIFHSHPSSAYPSGIDIPYMKYYYISGINKFKHLIWTIIDAKSQELNGFIIIFNELKQISIEITENNI